MNHLLERNQCLPPLIMRRSCIPGVSMTEQWVFLSVEAFPIFAKSIRVDLMAFHFLPAASGSPNGNIWFNGRFTARILRKNRIRDVPHCCKTTTAVQGYSVLASPMDTAKFLNVRDTGLKIGGKSGLEP